MSAGINRSLTTVKTELEFLYESEVITESLYEHIISLLPDRYVKGMNAADFNKERTNSVVNSIRAPSGPPSGPPPAFRETDPLPPPVYVEAIYDFTPQQSDDLKISAGDKIQIIDKPSDAWWKGSVNGRSGMFPSNYVRPWNADDEKKQLERREPSPPLNSPPNYQQNQQQSYYQQQPPQQQSYYQQQPYYQQQQPYQQQTSVPPMQVVQSQPVQQSSSTGSAFKKFGSKLGDAAIFGAGATIGSDLVNSIF